MRSIRRTRDASLSSRGLRKFERDAHVPLAGACVAELLGMNMRAGVGMLLLSMTVGGCVADADDTEETDEQGAEVKGYTRQCIDTNGATLDTSYAKQQSRTCVGRYLSFDGEHPALTKDEANRLHAGGVQIFAIWEVSKYGPVEGGSVAASRAHGIADAQQAKAKMAEVGGGNNPVYFTVDFDISQSEWKQKGPKVLAYFDGIVSVMGVNRTGAYGTYVTIKELFDNKKITFGWQMTFAGKGNQTDSRAQLRQTDIYANQTGWGVAGAGALDFDRAAKPDFGQW